MTVEGPVRQGDSICWYDRECLAHFDVSMFRPDYWRERNFELSSVEGRGTVWIVRGRERAFVLRHYHRGGLVGRINHDRFLREPVARSRAIREFRLLNQLLERGLPVPKPCAARMVPGWVSYRADIIVEWIPNSRNLAGLLQEGEIPVESWTRVGATIAAFHREGLFHSDLNCRNILIDDVGKVWLVDLDRCGFRRPGAWQGQNLRRLARSLRKVRRTLPDVHWDDLHWRALVAGYGSQSNP